MTGIVCDETVFPFNDIYGPNHRGLSIRDYFASHAIIPILERTKCANPVLAKIASREAYLIADAMIMERVKHNELQD